MKDFLGNEIKAGDRVVYAIRSGNCAVLRKGTVVELTERVNSWSRVQHTTPVLVVMADGGTNKSRLENIHNVVVISE